MGLSAVMGPAQFTSWIIHRGLRTPAAARTDPSPVTYTGTRATLLSCGHPPGGCAQSGRKPALVPPEAGLSLCPERLPCLYWDLSLAQSPRAWQGQALAAPVGPRADVVICSHFRKGFWNPSEQQRAFVGTRSPISAFQTAQGGRGPQAITETDPGVQCPTYGARRWGAQRGSTLRPRPGLPAPSPGGRGFGVESTGGSSQRLPDPALCDSLYMRYPEQVNPQKDTGR